MSADLQNVIRQLDHKPIIEQTISKEASLFPDGFGAHAGLDKVYKEHQILNKEKEG